VALTLIKIAVVLSLSVRNGAVVGGAVDCCGAHGWMPDSQL
jgi:hypothetical protein